MHTVGKIDREIYKCITGDIKTDEVIITDERISHIKERHPGDYEAVAPFLGTALDNPDYILQDGDREDTGLILKRISEADLRFQIVLRVHTAVDEIGFKNSVISAWQISEARWRNYINNKKILYKRE